MSDLGSRGDGSAKDRRTRLYNALVNRSTGEVRRPNQQAAFRAGSGNQFMRTYSTSKGKYQKYVQSVTADVNGRSVTMPKAEFNRMVERDYGLGERDAQQRAFYRNRRNAKKARKEARRRNQYDIPF